MKLRHFFRSYALVCLSLTLGIASETLAQSTSIDPEKLKFAAEEFDSGRRAYKLGDFGRAARHFENANRDAPSAQTLRMAIRSHDEAGQYDRAATLSVQALSAYGDSQETVQLAWQVLETRGPRLHKLAVACEPACSLLLDGRLVRDDDSSRQVIYAFEGSHTLVAGWPDNQSVSKSVTGSRGETTDLSFAAPTDRRQVTPGRETSSPIVSDNSSGKASPTLFWLGTGATAILGGITLWSGIDTLNNPGPDKVKEVCVGQGTRCPEYQDGRNKQTRTNALLLTTGVAAVSVGVIGLFFTDWGADLSNKGNSVGFTPLADPVQGQVGVVTTGRF